MSKTPSESGGLKASRVSANNIIHRFKVVSMTGGEVSTTEVAHLIDEAYGTDEVVEPLKIVSSWPCSCGQLDRGRTCVACLAKKALARLRGEKGGEDD